MSTLELKNISLTVGGADLVKASSLSITRGELVVLIGPNGAGKSSLMKCVVGAAKPTTGRVTIDGADINEMAPLERARRLSYLPQSRAAAWPITVRDVVALGRYAYGMSSGPAKGENAMIVQKSLETCGLEALAHRAIDTLSGGEQARVHCARIFASQAPLILADEPTNSLDPSGQLDIMALIRQHVDQGVSALVILHDINLASMFADRLIVMQDGRIVGDGSPADVLNVGLVRNVFGIHAGVRDSDEGRRIDFLRQDRANKV